MELEKMSVQSFIENVINDDIDLTESQIQGLLEALKNAYETMNECFKGKSTQDRHLRPFKSLISKEMLQRKKQTMPDIFYNFIDENVAIYIYYSKAGKYWIACRHWTMTESEIKAILYQYDLFLDSEIYCKSIEEQGTITKYLPCEKLEKAVFVWRKIINYYVQQSNNKDNYERYKTKIY